MDDRIFTITQAAQYLQVCEKTVRRLIKSNRLMASKVGDRSWRIRESDLNEYLITNTNMKGEAINE